MPYKDIFHRALDGELIEKTGPIKDLLRYIQEESDLNKHYINNSEDTRAKLNEFLGFIEEVLEIKEEVSSKSEFQLHHDSEKIEISDFDIDTKKAVLGQIKDGLNSVAPQEGDDDPASREISITLQTKKWVDILEKMVKHSEIIELLKISLQIQNDINQLYIEAAEVYDKKHDENGQQIRPDKRAPQAMQILGLNKEGKRPKSIDRNQLYLSFMIIYELYERRGKSPRESYDEIIENLASKFGATESTIHQYIKEEISQRRQEKFEYLRPHPQKTYLPRSG